MKIINVSKQIRYIPDERVIIYSTLPLNDDCWDEFLHTNSFTIDNTMPESASDTYFAFNKSFPTSAGIFLTNKCPLRCSYCFYNSGEGDNTTLPKSKINVFINRLIKNALMTRMVDHNYSPAIKIVLSGGGGANS